MEMKLCKKCNILKPYSEYYKDKKNKDGVCSHCKDCRNKKVKEWLSQNNKERNEYIKKYRKKNNEKKIEYYRQYRTINRNKIKQQQNLRRKIRRDTDILYRLIENIRTRTRLALKNNSKSKKTEELIGCSIEFLKGYITNKFLLGMNWENYGFGYDKWHIDHIIPCDAFDLSDIEQQKKCFHYTNLQPLWQKDNLKKGSKII
jgi:hypothetical protein